MEKLITKENIVIIVAVFTVIIQSNYFATKLDLANIKLDMAQIQSSLKEYTDNGDKEVLKNVEDKFQVLSNKLDKMR